jgi:hypothetical protein
VNPLVLAMAGSLALAGFHLLTLFFKDLPARQRATLASVSGGAGLAYVFLYLLFELVTEGAAKVHALAPLGPEPLATLFVVLLGALSVTHILQMELEKTASLQDDHHGFALLFIAYNFLAGAGLVEEANWGTVNLVFYVTAIGLHLSTIFFFCTDFPPTIPASGGVRSAPRRWPAAGSLLASASRSAHSTRRLRWLLAERSRMPFGANCRNVKAFGR